MAELLALCRGSDIIGHPVKLKVRSYHCTDALYEHCYHELMMPAYPLYGTTAVPIQQPD